MKYVSIWHLESMFFSCMLRGLSVSNPAEQSRTSDKAAWAMTSDFCIQPPEFFVERCPPRKASAGSACAVIHAGVTPNSMPVSRHTANVNASTGREGMALIAISLF